MADCPTCEYHKQRAQIWRDEVYRLAGHPLPRNEENMKQDESYKTWWHNEGSGIIPLPNEDMEEFAHRMTEIAWSNGAFKEREACAELKNILHPMNFGGKETYTTQELLDHMKTSIVDYSNAIRARGQA